MNTSGERFLLIAALMALCSGGQASTVYSSLGEPGDLYDQSAGYIIDGGVSGSSLTFSGVAFAFTAGGSGYLNQIRLAVCRSSVASTSTNLAKISINLDNGHNLPGTALETYLNVSCPGTFGSKNPLASVTSTTSPLLQAGVTYWLCVEPSVPSSALNWDFNSLGLNALCAGDGFPSAWHVAGTHTTGAFDVQVTPVPEPATVSLMALGILALSSRLERCRAFNAKPIK
jgi:hypothetical protein